MIQKIIIVNILLIFTPTINAISNIRTPSSSLKNLNKCCLMDRYVGDRKKCEDYNVTVSFSTIKIYDENKQLTGKSFDELFTLKPNKFKNVTFRRNIKVLDVMSLDYNVYLTESGLILVELPNAYDRWTAIPIDDYCIDMDHRLLEPRFWALINSEETQNFDTNLLLQIIGMMTSCVFILLVLVVYIMLPELQNLYGLILMAYLFSLFMAFTLLIVIQLPAVSIGNACLGLASGVYFFFLAAVCWMSVMSYDMWSTFRNTLRANSLRQGDRSKFLVYCLYAWGVPLLMTVFLVLVNTNRKIMRRLPWFVTPRIPENGCFLHGGVKLLYFYIPMLVLIIFNWIFYLMTALNICLTNRRTSVLDSGAAGPKQAHRDQRQMFMIYLKLSVVMGLSWLLEIISFGYPGYMWIISDAYNSLIGLALFLIFVCKKKMLKKLSERCGRKKKMYWSSKRTRSTKVDCIQENIALQLKVSSQPNGLNPTDDESEEDT